MTFLGWSEQVERAATSYLTAVGFALLGQVAFERVVTERVANLVASDDWSFGWNVFGVGVIGLICLLLVVRGLVLLTDAFVQLGEAPALKVASRFWPYIAMLGSFAVTVLVSIASSEFVDAVVALVE